MKEIYSTQYLELARISKEILVLSRTLNQVKTGQEITELDAQNLSRKKREIEHKIQTEGDELNTLVYDALTKQIQMIDKVLFSYLLSHPESGVN